MTITPNGKGLTNIEGITLNELKLIQMALRNEQKKAPWNKTVIEKSSLNTMIFETDMYFTYAARRIKEGVLTD